MELYIPDFHCRLLPEFSFEGIFEGFTGFYETR